MLCHHFISFFAPLSSGLTDHRVKNSLTRAFIVLYIQNINTESFHTFFIGILVCVFEWLTHKKFNFTLITEIKENKHMF